MPGAVYRNPPSGRRRERPRDEAPLSFGFEHATNNRVDGAEAARRAQADKKPDSGRRPDGPRAWELRLTPSMLIMAGVLTLVTLCFFFLFGLIIGRGTVPPPPAPELERLLPGENAAPEAPERILPEEDLRFMTNLRNDTPTEAADKPATDTVRPAPDAAPASRQPAQASSPDNGLYDFVLRVAAYKSEDQADALRARLEGAGMRTRMVREKAQKGTWYFVQVLYRGTRDHMEALRATLGDFGISDSIVSSTTPAR